MKYKDFYKHLLHEGMTATVSGKDYEQQDLQDLLGFYNKNVQMLLDYLV